VNAPLARYPAELECDVTMSDGRRLRMRPIMPSDGPGLRAFHAELSTWSVYLRYFGAHPTLSDRDVDHFTHVDYRDRLALVVEDGDRLVAVGRYDRLGDKEGGGGDPAEAEVAFVVSDAYQHNGIGTCLLERLAEAARRVGITAFVADTLAENRAMIKVFLTLGFPVTTTAHHEVVHVRFPIVPARSGDGVPPPDGPTPTADPSPSPHGSDHRC